MNETQTGSRACRNPLLVLGGEQAERGCPQPQPILKPGALAFAGSTVARSVWSAAKLCSRFRMDTDGGKAEASRPHSKRCARCGCGSAAPAPSPETVPTLATRLRRSRPFRRAVPGSLVSNPASRFGDRNSPFAITRVPARSPANSDGMLSSARSGDFGLGNQSGSISVKP